MYLRSRFVTYYDSTKPIIDHYEGLGLVRKVDAAQSVDQVSVQPIVLYMGIVGP